LHPDKTNAETAAFLKGMEELCASLDAIMLLVTRKTPLEDEECNKLEGICTSFGVTWRKHLESRPVYLHLVEGHVPTEMRRLRYVSFADEGSLERYHHLIKEMRRLFAPMRGWVKQTTAILRRFDKFSAPAVVTAMEKMKAGTKRTFKANTVSKRSAKASKKVETNTVKIEKAAAYKI
jgi:hypothetical protein